MKKFAFFLLLLLAVAGAAGYVAVRRLNEPFRGYEGDQLVDIPSGASTRSIGEAPIVSRSGRAATPGVCRLASTDSITR
jgi:cell division protein YceG involved in septum cleavage